MTVYRISGKNYSRDLTGTGSYLHGGRWNPRGIHMVYTSESVSLAALEIIVNLSSTIVKKDLFLTEIDVPETEVIQQRDLPDHWDAYPHSAATVNIGREFIQSGKLCLKVPSAVITSEHNLLLNPESASFDQVKILDSRPFILDRRLLKR